MIPVTKPAIVIPLNDPFSFLYFTLLDMATIPKIIPGIANHQRTKYDIKEKTNDIIPQTSAVTIDTPFYEKSITPPSVNNFLLFYYFPETAISLINKEGELTEPNNSKSLPISLT